MEEEGAARRLTCGGCQNTYYADLDRYPTQGNPHQPNCPDATLIWVRPTGAPPDICAWEPANIGIWWFTGIGYSQAGGQVTWHFQAGCDSVGWASYERSGGDCPEGTYTKVGDPPEGVGMPGELVVYEQS